MNTRPVIVGVNGTPESVRAAITAAAIAEKQGARCIPVGAEPDYQNSLIMSVGPSVETVRAAEDAEKYDYETVRRSLQGRVPGAVVDALEMRRGPAANVLTQAVQRHDAGLIVLGARWHRGFDRLRGRLTRHLLSSAGCPVLVTDAGSPTIERILVALDLSRASTPAWETAKAWAATFGARLRALHVIEPVAALPFASPKAQASFVADYLRMDEELREHDPWSTIDPATAEKVVRRGEAITGIVNEVRAWRADLLVVASHGKGWVDRWLVGSTTERLMAAPPAMTLVVPARAPVQEVEAADVAAVEPQPCAV